MPKPSRTALPRIPAPHHLGRRLGRRLPARFRVLLVARRLPVVGPALTARRLLRLARLARRHRQGRRRPAKGWHRPEVPRRPDAPPRPDAPQRPAGTPVARGPLPPPAPSPGLAPAPSSPPRGRPVAGARGRAETDGVRTVKTTAQATAAALTALLGAGAAAVAAGRLAGEAGLRPRPGRPLPTEPKLTVHTATADRITLTRALASLRPGVYGLASEDGRHAAVGRVLDSEAHRADTVVRELLGGADEFKPGTQAQLTPQVYAGTPRTARGLDYEDVEITGLPGALPAWFVPAARATWVIAAHGLGTTREHSLVLMDFLHRQQFPVLALSYRGDPGAPAAEGALSRFGADEWQDLEAAVRWAVGHGARRLVLLGWSTGASMALRVAARSEHRDRIAGLVLDSPVLSWQYALEGLARARRTPGFVLPLAVRAAEGRAGLPKERVDRAADPHALRVPVFLAQSEDDALAPAPLARAFARSRPDLVVTHTVDKAQHSAVWNRDPVSYEESLRRFLTPLM